MRKMTFTIPEETAARFTRQVNAAARSKYVAEAIEARLRDRERRLIEACDAANANEDVAQIEQEMDALSGDGLREILPDASPAR